MAIKIKKLGCCVVLFNPDGSVFSNISRYLPVMDYTVLVDNSDNQDISAGRISVSEKIEYISMGGNMGVAAALNAGCRALVENGCDTALTMDQDSGYPISDHAAVLELVSELFEDYSLVGLNYNNEVDVKAPAVVEAKYWLTSGNFLQLNDYETVGGFNDELFIDYVDIEFGHRLIMAGKRLCYLRDYSLTHSIGEPIEISFLGKSFYAMNHAPFRYYYRYRNSRYLYGQDRRFYGEKYFRELLVNIPKMILFEPRKRQKARMAFMGFLDGRAGALGKKEF